jgi:hypothetical protein
METVKPFVTSWDVETSPKLNMPYINSMNEASRMRSTHWTKEQVSWASKVYTHNDVEARNNWIETVIVPFVARTMTGLYSSLAIPNHIPREWCDYAISYMRNLGCYCFIRVAGSRGVDTTSDSYPWFNSPTVSVEDLDKFGAWSQSVKEKLKQLESPFLANTEVDTEQVDPSWRYALIGELCREGLICEWNEITNTLSVRAGYNT